VHLPLGAKRVGHRIDVTWAGGKRTFADKPPYNEPLSGISWYYCGYASDLKLHLLFKEEGDLFTGALLDDGTGAVLPGGMEVIFSPDKQYYIAYEMADGETTEILKLYRRDGRMLWQGQND